MKILKRWTATYTYIETDNRYPSIFRWLHREDGRREIEGAYNPDADRWDPIEGRAVKRELKEALDDRYPGTGHAK